jgi:hypothetical protein
VANTPPFRRLSSVATSTPPHPTPAPRHFLRTKASRQQFFLTIHNKF